MSSYRDKLLDVRWQKRRLEILQRDKFTCQSCFVGDADCGGSRRVTLHVHHHRYLRGKEPWEALDSDLVTLCDHCHQSQSDLMPEAVAGLIDIVKARGMFSDEVRLLANAIAVWPKRMSEFIEALPMPQSETVKVCDGAKQ